MNPDPTWHGPFTNAEEARAALAQIPGITAPYRIKIPMATVPLRIREVDTIEEVSGFTPARPGHVQGTPQNEGETCQDCDDPVDSEDPYHSTPCGTFCVSCMEDKHATTCGICQKEFDLLPA